MAVKKKQPAVAPSAKAVSSKKKTTTTPSAKKVTNTKAASPAQKKVGAKKVSSVDKPALKKSTEKKSQTAKSKNAKTVATTPVPSAPSKADLINSMLQRPTATTAFPSKKAEPKGKAAPKQRFSAKDLLEYKKELLSLRDKIMGRSGNMRNAALQGTDDINPEEDGTDAFLRVQTLDQVKNQHKDLACINAALRAIEEGTYGVCESCGELIRKQRLAVLPFAKNCIKCQSELEKQNRRR